MVEGVEKIEAALQADRFAEPGKVTVLQPAGIHLNPARIAVEVAFKVAFRGGAGRRESRWTSAARGRIAGGCATR